MKNLIAILWLAFACIGSGMAQDNSQNTKRFIEITGTSETEATPDEIYITITLQERNEGKEKITIEKQEAELKQILKDLGIDLSNLALNSADADYRKIRTFKKDVMIVKAYGLKISGTDMLTKIYERLDKMNAQDAYISRYTHSKILDLKKDNRIKAIKAGKDKVDYLLAAIGQSAGQPIEIRELENFVQENPRDYRPRSNAQAFYSNARVDESDNSADEISFKKIKIRSSFQLKYEILSK